MPTNQKEPNHLDRNEAKRRDLAHAHKPQKERICCVCRAKDLATTRIRIARIKSADGSYNYSIDKSGNANGRGAYVCPTCIDQCIKKRALNRTFKGNVPQEIYSELLNFVKQ
ncbi:MAG: YlxR family protein [Firmicutes bacterium]|nr:YlxR family protein [Bacillota bacterium]